MKQGHVERGREFFPTICDYDLPTKPFRDVYFAYMPPREIESFARRPWCRHEFKDMRGAKICKWLLLIVSDMLLWKVHCRHIKCVEIQNVCFYTSHLQKIPTLRTYKPNLLQGFPVSTVLWHLHLIRSTPSTYSLSHFSKLKNLEPPTQLELQRCYALLHVTWVMGYLVIKRAIKSN